MERQQVIATLRAHEPELKKLGITQLSLFGSVARGESGSDVDLMADFDESRRFTLLDMVHLEDRLSVILGAPVDLAPRKMLKDPVREHSSREGLVAF